MLVSSPVAEISGLFPVAELVTDISFIAEAVFSNLIYSFPESSCMLVASGSLIETVEFKWVSVKVKTVPVAVVVNPSIVKTTPEGKVITFVAVLIENMDKLSRYKPFFFNLNSLNNV